MITEELIAVLGFELDDKNLKKFKTGIEQAATGLAGFTATVGASALALGAMVITSIHTAEGIIRASTAAGLGAEEFQRLANAASLSGVSSDELATSLRFLSKQVYEATTNRTSDIAMEFRKFGVELFGANNQARTTTDILKQLSARYSTLDNAQKKAALSQMFFGRGAGAITNFLNEGPDKIAEAAAEFDALFGVLSTKQITNLKNLGDEITKIQGFFSGLKNQVASELAPAFTEILKDFVGVLIENKDTIRDIFQSMVKGLSAFLTLIGKAFRPAILFFFLLAKHIGGVEEAVALLTSGMALMFSAFMLAGLAKVAAAILSIGGAALLAQLEFAALPLAVVAALGAVALAIDDFVAWWQGRPSVIGYLLGEEDKNAAQTAARRRNIFDKVTTIGPLGLAGSIGTKLGVNLGEKLYNAASSYFNQNNTINITIPPGMNPEDAVSAVERGTSSGVQQATDRAAVNGGGIEP